MTNHNFTAIDFETAQGKRWSICQVGLIRVENSKVVKSLNILVRPPENFYMYRNTEVHGLTARHTATSPTFDRVWPHIEPYIKDQQVVAHNGFGFDFGCLAKTLEYYEMPVPEYDKHCTYKLFGAKLNVLCAQYNIPLNHHDALSDAMACARLFMIHLMGKRV